MSKLAFGEVARCPACKGRNGIYTKEGKRHRAKQLRDAKRDGRAAPPITSDCPRCDGKGYVPV